MTSGRIWLTAYITKHPNFWFSMMTNVVLYTRVGCQLCDDALDLLCRHGLAPECIDIDSDADLSAKFDECVPVVEIDGKVRFRGRISEVLLRRILNAE